jgi:hypothetical protein
VPSAAGAVILHSHADAMIQILEVLQAFCELRGVEHVAKLVGKVDVEHEPIER